MHFPIKGPPTKGLGPAMRKLYKRTAMAESQFQRRHKRAKERDAKDEERNTRAQNSMVNKETAKLWKTAQEAMKEDYRLGPLAPRRDVGSQKDIYGSVGGRLIRGPQLLAGSTRQKQFQANLEGFGGHLYVVNDRVVVIEGHDKGKIGVIKEIDEETGEAVVGGMNLVDAAIPELMRTQAGNRSVETMEKPISLLHLRLVYPVHNKELRRTRDVVVKKLIAGHRLWDNRLAGRPLLQRFIPMPDGKPLRVDYPPHNKEQMKEYDIDMRRIDVEQRTFIPTLLGPPMPETVIDELRNKYSVFRTRHEPEYIEKKVAQDAATLEKQKLEKLMLTTPLKEINRKERKLRKKMTKGELSPALLARIGWTMQAKKILQSRPTEGSGHGLAARARLAAHV